MGLASPKFFSVAGQSKDITVSTSSSSQTLSGTGDTLRMVNAGPTPCRVRYGPSAQTAVVADMLLLVGVEYLFGCGADDPNVYVAAITASSSTTLNVARGNGV